MARDLDVRLRGTLITDAWTQDRDELTLALSQNGVEVFLRVSCADRAASIHLKHDVARARRNTASVLASVRGRRITHVRIADGDRAIALLLDDATLLVALLRSQRANVLHVGSGAGIIGTFRIFASDILIPCSWTLDAPPVSADDFAHVLSAHPDLILTKALRVLHPWLSGTFAQELLHRSGLDGERTIGELRRDTVTNGTGDAARAEDRVSTISQSLAHTVQEMVLESASAPWHVYGQLLHPGSGEETTPVLFSPCALSHRSFDDDRHYDDLQEALDWFVRRRARDVRIDSLQQRVLRALNRERTRIERLLGHIETPEALKKRAAEYEKFGNLLMINLTSTPTQPGRMIVPDLFTDPRLVADIPIDPRMGVLENAQRYFDKARASRGAADHAGGRISSARTRFERIVALEHEIRASHDIRSLTHLFQSHHDLMESLGLTPKGENNNQPFPFRRFTVAGGFEVWAGKSSANNDELTVRWAKPNDLWFHARGVGGSHVIIRNGSAPGEPSKEAIRQAASIAAYYSKHRNAKTVPVAYTEKKYVRKPRGVPAGTVHLEREKVIMVPPELPPSSEPGND